MGKDRQPPLLLESPGAYKHIDPYVTTNKLTHVPFTNHQLNGIAKKDVVTFYNSSNIGETVHTLNSSWYMIFYVCHVGKTKCL